MQASFRDGKAHRRPSRSRKLSEVNMLDYDAVFLCGGLGPMVDITGNPEVQAVGESLADALRARV